MIKFSYKIRTEDDLFQTGYINAVDYDGAKKILSELGYEIIYISYPKTLSDILFPNYLNLQELILFFSSISAMDSVGINILKSMELLKDEIAQTNNMKRVCRTIYGNILSGKSFSESCQLASRSFTNDIVGLIKISEQTGKFANVFDRLIEYLKWVKDINDKYKKVIRGPILTLSFMLVMIVVMSTVAIPKIVDFLKYFNVKPPLTTILLIDFSNFLKKYYPLCIFIPIITYLSTSIAGKLSNKAKIRIDQVKLSIPIFGNLIIKINTSKFISFFILMYNAGAPILEILSSVSNILQNRYIAHKVEIIKNEVESGISIFQAIDKQKIFPVMFRKMMSVSEATGNPSSVLSNVKSFYDKEISDTIEKVIGTIKPAMTVILGALLMWIGSAMLGPIYSNIGNLGGNSSQSSSNIAE